MNRTIYVIYFIFFVFTGTLTSAQTTFTVINTNDSGTGSLRQAMLNVMGSSSAGPFTITASAISGTINLSSSLPDITKDIAFIGPGASSLTVRRNSGGNYRIFNIPYPSDAIATVSFDGFTIADSFADQDNGGAIENWGLLTLSNCVFRNNEATYEGGAIRNLSSLTVNNCLFDGNKAGSFGGGLSNGGSSCSITNTTFTSNTANQGGGMTLLGDNAIITNSLFTGNYASFSAGGIWVNGSSITISNCTISSNTAGVGGGINSSVGTHTIINSTITRNIAQGTAGLRIINGAHPTIINCIVAGNTSDNADYNNIESTLGSGSTNNIIGPGNTGGLTNGVNGNQLGVDPLLSVLGNYGGSRQTHALLPGSPAINAGTASGAPTTDDRGISRVGVTDIGSFESRGFSMARTSGNSQSAVVNTVFANPLVVTLSSSFSEPVDGGVVTFTGPNSGAAINPVSVTASIANTTASASVTANATVGGPYSVVASANGASPNRTFALTNLIGPPTIAGFAAIDNTVCIGSPITFTATVGNVTGNYDFTVTNGNSTTTGNTSSTAFSQNLTATGSSVQSFTLIVIDNSQSARATTSVTINSLPTATIQAPASTTLTCTTTSLALTATGGGTYRWNDNSTSAIRTVSAPGTYSVTVTGANGCTATTNSTIYSSTAVVSVTNPLITTALVGTAFSQFFTASSGTAPLSFSIESGSLPSSLTLSTTGILSGTPTQNGTISITVRVTDANGCSGVGSTYILQVRATATVTTTVPGSILETSATLGGSVTADGGSSVTERGVVYITGNGTPTTSDTKVTMGSGTGNYSQTVSNLVSGTTYSVRAYAINGVGTSYGAVQSFTTTSAPPAPVVLTPTNGSQLSNNRPTYSGTATPVSSVTVFVDDGYAGDITADASGNWSFTPSVSLPDGTHRVFARAMLNSLTSPNSNTNTFSIDTTPPAAPFISGPANGTTTNDNTPTYAGTAEPSSTVTVRVDGSVIGTPSADASGNWNFTPSAPLADGSHNVRATATDQVGNTGPASSTITFTIDTTSPTVSITSTAPNPTSTSPIPLTITFSESVTGFLAGDITVTNGTVSDFAGAGSSYTVNLVPGSAGTVSVSVGPGVAQDLGGNGNSPSSPFSIQFTPTITISDFTANPDPVCVGNQVTFTANLGNLTGSYTYTLTNGTSTTTGASSNTSFSQLITTTASGSQAFSLTVSNNGQLATETYDLTVSDLPAVTLTASHEGVLTCGQTSLTLTATGGDDYVFSGPGILNQDSENGIAVVNAPGTYSVTVTNTETGCFSTTTTTITSNTASPSVSILLPASSTLTCTTTSISLTATGGGTYHWEDNSGNAVRTVSNAGTYSVTVTGTNGCTATASTNIGQSTTIAGFSVTGSATACTGGQVTLTASGCSGGTIAWPGSITGAVFSTTISGQYTATCTIGSCSATASGTATVGNAFTVTTPSISTALAGVHMVNTLDWSASGGSSPYSFSFSTLPSGLSVVTASAGFRSIGGTPTQAGTYPISLTVTDNLGCAQEASPYSLTVNCPTFTLTTPSISTALAGVHMVNTLDWSASGGTSPYSFTFSSLPSGLSVVTASAAFRSIGGTPTQAGSFPISLTVTDKLGCAQEASPYSLTVNCPTFTLTTPSISTALVGVHMVNTLDWSASGGTSPYSFTFSSLPAGLSVVTASSAFRSIGGTPTQAGTYPISLTVTDNLGCSQVAAPFSLTVNCSTLTTGLTPTPSATLTCAQTSLTLTASGGSTYAFAGPGIVSQNATAGTAVVNTAGTYSVTVTNSVGCSAITTTTISSNTVLSLATGASLPMANVGVVVSLTASGATSYQWTAPSTAPLTTPATGSAVSVSLTTAGVQTFTVVATAGVCSQSALVSVTALAGPDLSAIMSLPDGNFTAGENKGLLVQLQEVNGAVSSGSIIITITVPTGYSISFDNTLTSINVSGGTTNPVAVQNSKWHVSNTVAGQQLSLAINSGESVGANSTLNLGFTITRTTANPGSTSNITINVADDGGGTYDVNRLNNIYARIINGL
ncbi:beta strand repeat-containing protein [Spirosoma gilvum]